MTLCITMQNFIIRSRIVAEICQLIFELAAVYHVGFVVRVPVTTHEDWSLSLCKIWLELI